MAATIYELLKRDHDTVKGLLDELVRLETDDDYADVLIEQIKQELVPHSRAEESVFYNSIRAVASDSSRVMHSYKEHMEVETQLRALQTKGNWISAAFKLREALDHHIAEEESTLFAEARTLFSEEEAIMMGTAFIQLKQRVAKEGFMKTSFDLVANLMPPRFVDMLKSLGSPDRA